MKKPVVIVAGAPKSGTTSVFKFLAEHPEVCGSRVKEPAFFINDYSSDARKNLALYSENFSHCGKGDYTYYLEASAGYINHAGVARKIHDFLGENCRLIFILRNPVDRLYSNYRFQQSRYIFPETLDFDEYIAISEGRLPNSHDIESRHFQVLEQGRYINYLRDFIDVIGRERISILIYEDFRNDNRKTMNQLCSFLEIDSNFYEYYSFVSANVTTSGRIRFLHALALRCNGILEPLLRQRPAIKQKIVSVYKKLNTIGPGYAAMSVETRESLEAYYRDSIEKLEKQLQFNTNWISQN